LEVPAEAGFQVYDEMKAIKIMAIVLNIACLLGLAYGRFSYTRETQEAKLGRKRSVLLFVKHNFQ
jgi:hypothetical protein